MHYTFGDYTLDTQCYTLCRAGTPVHVRPKVFHVLAYLLAQRDRVVSKDELIAQVWPGQSISDETLSSCITAARRAVADSGQAQRVLQTRHGHGYRFVAAVEVCDHPPLAAAASVGSLVVAEGTRQSFLAAAPLPEATRSDGAAPTGSLVPPRPRALVGEHKVVTVVVGMLVPAAPRTQRQEAEVWHQVLQGLLTGLLEEVERYGGTLQTVQDDGFLALFGAPVAQEDHARRAVRAALAIQQHLRAGPGAPAGPPGEGSSVRLGLHTGQILLGRLGAAQRLIYTAVGDTTRHATRLAQQAAPGALLVSAATAQLVHDEVRLMACAPEPLPGQADALRAYQVLGFGPRRHPLLPDGVRPRSRFVGRELELATLRALRARVAEGQGQVVGIVGEPGMGKTRFLAECWQRLGDSGGTMLVGRCVSYGQATPYGPVLDLLRQACGLTEVDSPATITASVQQSLQALGLPLAETAPVLLHLLGVPEGVTQLAGRSPQEIRAQTFATLHQLLRHASQRSPLLVVVENLHWIDPTSEAYLAEVVARLPSVPLLLLVTFRPGYRPPWMEQSYATQLALPQLGATESRCVVQGVLAPAAVPEPLMQVLLAKAAGNPLFLEELAWTVREHGVLQLPSDVPDTVQAVLAARIDRLPPAAKQVLQVAAVIGSEVPRPLLQGIADLSEETLHHSLAHLQAAELLYETCLLPEHTYTFKHVLTHEVAYGSLLQEPRRLLHTRIVEAMEQLAPHRLADQVERLAYHARRGEVWPKAFLYSRQAGAKALVGSAYREAVRCFEQALEALASFLPDRPTREQAIDLCCDLSTALTPFSQWEQALLHLHSAESIAEALGDHRRLRRVYRRIASTLRQMQDLEPALAYCQKAHAMTTALEDVDTHLWVNHTMGMIYFDLARYRQAMACLQQMLMTVQSDQYQSFGGLALPSVQARVWMARCLGEVGRFADGRAYGDEAWQIAEVINRPYERLAVYTWMGILHVRQGTLHTAIQLFEQAVALSQETNIPNLYYISAVHLALAYALAGRAADARSVLGIGCGEPESAPNLLAWGEAYLRTGGVEEAHQLTQRALANARHRNKQGWEAWALWLLGEIATRPDLPDVVSAATHYRQALALAEALGMRPLQAHCQHGLGRLYVTTGRQEQAHTALCSAMELFRTMEMTFWLSETEAALAQVD